MKTENQDNLEKKSFKILKRHILFMAQNPGKKNGRINSIRERTLRILGENILRIGQIKRKIEDR